MTKKAAETTRVVRWKNEDEENSTGMPIGPVWFEGFTDEELEAVAMKSSTSEQPVWVRKEDALVIAAQLGARFEEV